MAGEERRQESGEDLKKWVAIVESVIRRSKHLDFCVVLALKEDPEDGGTWVAMSRGFAEEVKPEDVKLLAIVDQSLQHAAFVANQVLLRQRKRRN